MSGKDYQVYLSSDNTDIGTKTLVEYQGDLTVNDGRTVNRTNYKVGSKTSQGNDGWSASFQIGADEPVPAGQTILWAASDGDLQAYMWIESTITGSRRWEGPVKVIVTESSFPVDGEPSFTVEMSEDGTITRDTVA